MSTREIKFRVWLPDRVAYCQSKKETITTTKRKKFIYFTMQDLVELDSVKHELITHAEIQIDELDLSLNWQQYTGLKDKNGKEIYEGDMLKIGSFSNAVTWDDFFGSFLVGNFRVTQQEVDKATIVGNIYENPELAGSGDAA